MIVYVDMLEKLIRYIKSDVRNEGKVLKIKEYKDGNDNSIFKRCAHLKFPTLYKLEKIFKFLYIPASYVGEIYYSIIGNKLLLTDNFYIICREAEANEVDEQVLQEFNSGNSRTRGSLTFFKEIKKCEPRTIYYIKNGQFNECDVPLFDRNMNGRSGLYGLFKKQLEKAVLKNVKGKCALLLSGGVDSRLILSIFISNKIDFIAYTVLSKPYMDDNIKDVEIAKKLSMELNFKLKIVVSDWYAAEPLEYAQFIVDMPQTCHLSYSYISLLKAIKKDGINTVFTGQNADSLYAYGFSDHFEFTKRGLSTAFSRMLLSEPYFKNLSDVKEKDLVSKVCLKPLISLGTCIYEVIKHKKIILPRSSKDLLKALGSSKCVLFSNEYGKRVDSECSNCDCISSHDVCKMLLNEKIKNFCKCGDSESIRIAALDYSDAQVVFPYSSEEMLKFFASNHLSYQDIIIPKAFSYKLAREYGHTIHKVLGNFSLRFTHEIKELYSSATIYDYDGWSIEILDNTKIGSMIKKEINIDVERNIPGQVVLNKYLSEFWKLCVMRKAEDSIRCLRR